MGGGQGGGGMVPRRENDFRGNVTRSPNSLYEGRKEGRKERRKDGWMGGRKEGRKEEGTEGREK